MKSRTFVLTMFLAGLAMATSAAQQPSPPSPRASTPAPAPAAAPAARAATPRRQGQPVNIKVDLSITDQRAGSPPIKRTLSMIVADLMSGSVRSQSDVMGVGPVPLNVDVEPELLADSKIRLRLVVQYDWPAPFETGNPREVPRGTVIKTTLHDSVSLILENGKSMIAAQSADPLGDRQVTVEVKGTVLR